MNSIGQIRLDELDGWMGRIDGWMYGMNGLN